MPDIFGRNPTDYAHIRAMMKQGVWDSHCRAVEASGSPRHDFNALGAGPRLGLKDWGLYDSLPVQKRTEVNAQAAGYMTNNLQAIIAMVDEIVYLGGRRLTDHIPIRTDIAEGAKSYIHRVVDRGGFGKFITTEGTDAPTARASLRNVPVNLGYGGIDAVWTVEDLRAAMFGGFALDMQSLQAAADGAINHICDVALRGDSEEFGSGENGKGLINKGTGTGLVTLTTLGAVWDFTSSAGVETAIGDIRAAVSRIISGSKETLPRIINGELHIALPTGVFDSVMNTRYGMDSGDRSVGNWFMNNNPWTTRGGGPVIFTSIPELDEAGASNVDRMVVYCKSTDVLEQAHAINPRVLRIVDQGRVICAQMEYKVGPLFMGRPTTVQYVDNVAA